MRKTSAPFSEEQIQEAVRRARKLSTPPCDEDNIINLLQLTREWYAHILTSVVENGYNEYGLLPTSDATLALRDALFTGLMLGRTLYGYEPEDSTDVEQTKPR
jgi:hypothetical protein